MIDVFFGRAERAGGPERARRRIQLKRTHRQPVVRLELSSTRRNGDVKGLLHTKATLQQQQYSRKRVVTSVFVDCLYEMRLEGSRVFYAAHVSYTYSDSSAHLSVLRALTFSPGDIKQRDYPENATFPFTEFTNMRTLVFGKRVLRSVYRNSESIVDCTRFVKTVISLINTNVRSYV